MANEKRLINVNPAYIQHVLAKVPYYADEIWKFTAMTERFPTVDAVEVVHGRWIESTNTDYMMSQFTCSECGVKYIAKTWNYCPNCGAYMGDLE